MKKLYLQKALFFVFNLFTIYSYSQNVTVQIDPNCQRFIGNVSQLDRTKYFNFHSNGDQNDSEISAFMQEYNVGTGRQFWGPFSYAKSKTGEVGVYPDYKTGNDNVRTVKRIISTEHPSNVFIDGLDPVIAGDWSAEYFKNFVENGNVPEFFEPMNEPFVHASDFVSGGWNNEENSRMKQQMAEIFNQIGIHIHNSPALENMKVLGYSSAYPSLEINDFSHWEDNMKRFMDTAGENMDGISTHLYDGINVTGQDTFRSGSNSEAILDLIENYSYYKWGIIKPHAISEYGGIENGYGDDFSLIANVQSIRSINHFLFNLLNREDRLLISIPFIGDKSTWHITEANNYQPYGAVLFVPTNIGEPTIAGWEYTKRIHFFDLWKEVKGKRVFIKSNNPDVQVHAFANGNKMYVGISNLDTNSQTVDLSFLSGLSEIESVRIKSLKIYDQTLPDYTDETLTNIPTSINLIYDETVTLEYTFSNEINFDNAIRGKNYYTTNHLETINANTPINYSFTNIETGDGYATLRMSIGRKHDVSKNPTVKVNGTTVEVPNNWQGYNQANRDDFFGMIEIPFSANLLQENNTVSVEFPDAGGRVSSLILNVELFDNAKNTLSLQTFGSTCPNTENGKITIEPLIPTTYTVEISGEGINNSYNFSSTFTIEDLAVGTYTVIVTSSTNQNFKEEYKIYISEPEELSAKSAINQTSKTATYTLRGGTNYTITVNNKVLTTSASTVKIPLVNGKNSIEITADKECQGIYTEELFIGKEIVAYPNPFTNNFTIDLGVDESKITQINIYNSIGNLVLSKNYTTKNNKIQLSNLHLKKGIYLLSVKTENTTQNLKIIHQ